MMIRSNMALSHDDAARVCGRKGIWMVEYLRARRSKDRLIGFFRRQHFKSKREQAG
ncbi:hypothetical protein [Phaeobacter inhibens]|uniref:hypothetical protein n=1 Tax=Phaeobacter inhibens TaxID=221822 RepID=UPI000CA20E5B|nr:hypothetical protein [Phaeobacter inhibens]AUQ62156.1 hypothetical protein PhaeoP51_01159 [Phaeobacter inhibens]AUQ89867.1 hypothetical protein PhaeoP24_01240 [Phaeobacter inhibens]